PIGPARMAKLNGLSRPFSMSGLTPSPITPTHTASWRCLVGSVSTIAQGPIPLLSIRDEYHQQAQAIWRLLPLRVAVLTISPPQIADHVSPRCPETAPSSGARMP